MKAKIDKDKNQIIAEIADVRAATDEVSRSKASAEKTMRNLNNTLNELNKKVEECNLNLGDMEQFKRRLTAENADLLRQLQELENNAGLVGQLDEQKSIADNETRERTSLLGKYRNMEHEVDGLKSTFNDEVSSRENIERQVSKALS